LVISVITAPGSDDVRHPADFQQVGFQVVKSRFALEAQRVLVGVDGEEAAEFAFLHFEGDRLLLHVPVEFVERSLVLVVGQGSGEELGVGLEPAHLLVEVHLAVEVGRGEGEGVGIKGLDFQVGGVGSGRVSAEAEQRGGHAGLVPI
jgi:hypothetical protein